MWSAVPGLDDLSSDSEHEEVKSGHNSKDESDDDNGATASKFTTFADNIAPPRGVDEQHWQVCANENNTKFTHFVHSFNFSICFCSSTVCMI